MHEQDLKVLAVGLISDAFVQLGKKNPEKRREAANWINSVHFEAWVSVLWLDVTYLREIAARIEAGELRIARHIEWAIRDSKETRDDRSDECGDEMRHLWGGEEDRVGEDGGDPEPVYDWPDSEGVGLVLGGQEGPRDLRSVLA